MKKKIAILGSTGSIGKTLVNIIKQDKKNFEIVLLSAEGTLNLLLLNPLLTLHRGWCLIVSVIHLIPYQLIY